VCFLVDCVDLSESSRCYAKILCKPSLSCFSLFKLLKTPAKFLSVTKLSHDFLGVYREEIILGKDKLDFSPIKLKRTNAKSNIEISLKSL